MKADAGGMGVRVGWGWGWGFGREVWCGRAQVPVTDVGGVGEFRGAEEGVAAQARVGELYAVAEGGVEADDDYVGVEGGGCVGHEGGWCLGRLAHN